MKKKLLICLMILAKISFAQKDSANSKYLPLNSNKELLEQTYQVINEELKDSLYKNYEYFIDEYYSFIKEINYYIIYPNKKACKKRYFILNKLRTDPDDRYICDTTGSIKIIIYENPFAPSDSVFTTYQQKDTTSKLNIASVKYKIPISKDKKESDCVIMIEKPIFSEDLKSAFIKTAIDCMLGGSCYISLYIKENGIWKMIKRECTFIKS